MTTPEETDLVTDPFLLSILQSSASAREATISLLNLLSTSRTSEPTTSVDIEIADDDTSSAVDAINKARKELYGRLTKLRNQNRRLAHNLRSTKSVTAASRSEIDTLHLSLQNLYYESRHLAGEISACESFAHKYTQLPLVPEDEFLEQNPEMRESGDEEIMKARIEQEYDARVEFEEKRKQLVARKMELVKENAKRKEELVKLDTDLEAFIEASKPIQKTFEKEY